MNWRKNWLSYVIFGGGLLLVIGLLIHEAVTRPRKMEYFYMSKGPVFHLDQRCNSKAVFIKAGEVFDGAYPDICFCSYCISPEELEQIHDSISIRHFIVTSSDR